MKNKTPLIAFIFSLIFTTQSFAQIMQNQNYNQEYDSASQVLKSCIVSRNPAQMYDKTVIFCPNIWDEILNSGIKNNITGIDVNFHTKNGIIPGKAIQSYMEFENIWEFIVLRDSFNVRKPDSIEIETYWKIISHNIEDPLVVFYSESYVYIAEMDKYNYSILFIEKLK